MGKVVLFTDIHLKVNNENQVIEACEEIVDFCVKNDIVRCICLGDVFDSRVAQRQSVLVAWDHCLSRFEEECINLDIIQGNHDMTDYESDKSFLWAYRNRKSTTRIISNPIEDIVEDCCFTFVPFQSDELLIESLKSIQNKKKRDKNRILLGHFSLQGSKNHNKEVDSNITRDLFDKYDKVILGHFHDYQEFGKFTHIGSLFQNNFGEEESNKGFWLLDAEDLSLENIPLKSKISYKKIELDVTNMTMKHINKTIEKFKDENPNSMLRVEIIGDTSSVKAFDKTKCQELGIDVKRKYSDVEVDINAVETQEIKQLDDKDIEKKFRDFCKDREYNEKEGLEILKEIMLNASKL